MPRPFGKATKEEWKAYREGLRNPKKPLKGNALTTFVAKLDDLESTITAANVDQDNKDKSVEILNRLRRKMMLFLTGTRT